MNAAKVKYIFSMLIFGSIGLLVRMLPFPSAQIALGRGLTGCLFLLVLVLLFRKRLSIQRIRADLIILILSGAAIGINWILLFESYRYTSIANATICYYAAPVIVVLLSPVILKEKLTLVKIGCIGGALLGIVLITGSGEPGSNDIAGIFYGLGAAVFYASVILLNKFLRQVTDLERTIVQLAVGAVTLLPYVLLSSTLTASYFSLKNVLILAVIGVVHTGFAYYLYFSGLHGLKGQTAALLSYVDPLAAILLSAVLLGEPMRGLQILGGCLILGGTFVNDFLQKKIE